MGLADDKLTPGEERETRSALRHLGAVSLSLLLMMALSYAVPAFERFEPWVPGSPLPLSDLYRDWGAVPAFAGAGGGYTSTSPIAEVSVEDELARDAERRAALRSSDSGGPETEEAPRIIDEEEYAGIEHHLVDPEHRGMQAFYEALYRTATGEGAQLTRVAQYGDSSIATDLITHTMRRRLQTRFGDGGHGFHLVSRGHLAYRHIDVSHSASADWKLREVVRRQSSAGLYGYGGVSAQGFPGSWARFGTSTRGPVGGSVSRFQVYYQKYRRGGDIRVRVDRGEPSMIHTRQETTEDAVETIEVPDGAHELELRFGGRGQPLIYGVVLEREGPGVVYDSLGLVGARANRLLNYDAEHIRWQLEQRGVNLVVLGFGGNEADDRIESSEYQADFERVIDRMRGGRDDVSCLILAPLDQAHRNDRGRIVTLRSVPRIVEAQRFAAATKGCAFFDTFHAMGGEGAMRHWYRRERPRLAMSDFRHATPAGYERIGGWLYRAMIEGFARWLEQRD